MAKLSFVNGENLECQCKYDYSDGHGEYSNVAYVHLCDKHSGIKEDILSETVYRLSWCYKTILDAIPQDVHLNVKPKWLPFLQMEQQLAKQLLLSRNNEEPKFSPIAFPLGSNYKNIHTGEVYKLCEVADNRIGLISEKSGKIAYSSEVENVDCVKYEEMNTVFKDFVQNFAKVN